jgi:hypothetical protein
MSLGKSGADVRSEPSNSPLIEMSEKQLSSYTPEQLGILEAQRNDVRSTLNTLYPTCSFSDILF